MLLLNSLINERVSVLIRRNVRWSSHVVCFCGSRCSAWLNMSFRKHSAGGKIVLGFHHYCGLETFLSKSCSFHTFRNFPQWTLWRRWKRRKNSAPCLHPWNKNVQNCNHGQNERKRMRGIKHNVLCCSRKTIKNQAWLSLHQSCT